MEKKFRITYQTAKGSAVKYVDTYKEMGKILAELDKRIEKGTCLGYMVTETIKRRFK